jgi:serine phosphatase RsbU (regulator of sigma subunit)
MTATSLELMDESMPAASRDALEKGVLMVVAILLAFGLREVALRGQRLLATKFHRRGYDYRGAARAITDVTATRLKLEGLGAGLLEVIVTQLPVKRAGLVLIHDRHVHCARGAHGFAEDQWSRLCLQWSGEVLALMRDARGELSADYAPPRIGDALRSAGLEFIYPLRAHDRLVGLLFMGEKQSESAYQNADFEFLAAMASQAAGSVENAFLYEELAGQERLKHELQIARQIQMESLPQFTPRVDGLEVAGISIPAMEVGGDYFDYLNGRRDHLTVMVGDVSGKGTSAALYMSRLQGIVRSLHAFDLSPRELFIRTNQLISRDLERRAFVTALGGFFDTRQGRLVLARAGHLPLYQYRHDRHEVVTWLPRGLGFGLSTRPIFDSELEEATLAYHPGDVFLFLTDGVTECQNGAGELFGEERLLALLTQEAHRAPSATALRDCITSATREFAAGADPYDDQTVVVVRAV